MHPGIVQMLVADHIDGLVEEARRERLRRAAVGSGNGRSSRRPRFPLRIHLRWPWRWTPRPAG
jgi:hypothetical protein